MTRTIVIGDNVGYVLQVDVANYVRLVSINLYCISVIVLGIFLFRVITMLKGNSIKALVLRPDFKTVVLYFLCIRIAEIKREWSGELCLTNYYWDSVLCHYA